VVVLCHQGWNFGKSLDILRNRVIIRSLEGAVGYAGVAFISDTGRVKAPVDEDEVLHRRT
jgi:hypothetical protein